MEPSLGGLVLSLDLVSNKTQYINTSYATQMSSLVIGSYAGVLSGRTAAFFAADWCRPASVLSTQAYAYPSIYLNMHT